jgi:hypothetical protein
LKLEVAPSRIVLDGATTTTTTTTSIVKWFGSIATHQNLGKTMVKIFWAPETLKLLVAFIS